MGNCFSVSLSCDALLIFCVQCAAREAIYVCQLEDNLKALQTARGQLMATRADVMQRVSNEEEPGTRRLAVVEDWRLRVEAMGTEVDELIEAGPRETEKLCVGGCCSKNYKSTYVFGKTVSVKKEEVIGLKNEGDELLQRGKLVERAPAEPRYISQLEDNLERLQHEKEDLRGLKEDVMREVILQEAQHKKKRLAQVQSWFSRVEAVIAEVNKLIEDGPLEIQKLHGGGCSSSMFGEMVVKKLEDVVALKSKGDFKVVAERELPRPVIERDIEPTVGLETKINEAWSYLTEEQEAGIMGIYGMGGVGKTTLLAEINNKFLTTPNNFDAVIWVTVSMNFKIEKIQEDIWKSLGFPIEQWKNRSPKEKAQDIFKVLCNQQFVLLLDDIWNRIDLKQVGIPLPKKERKFKVVFTTRFQAVCGQMGAKRKIRVEPLSEEKAWRLFQETVGEDIDKNILPLAQDVSKECGGLPIALITVARAMGCKMHQEWKNAIKILRESASTLQGMKEDVFVPLKFSYDSLPSDKDRSCFLYCALFPEDFTISKDDLVDYWFCENFCDRDEGYDIIGTLVRACLLEEEDGSIKMHDVIREMAVWIACDYEKMKRNVLIKVGANLAKVPQVDNWGVLTRISLMKNKLKEFREAPSCPNLLTLLLCLNPFETMGNFLQSKNSLTVLDLSQTSIMQLPPGISELASLQYLNISRTLLKELPLELNKLTKLKYLNLEFIDSMLMIPRQLISSLLLLEVLRMFSCGLCCEEMEDDTILSSGSALVEELNCLEDLKVLTITIRSVHMLNSFLEVSKLFSCTRSLCLAHFTGPKSLDISCLANLMHLEKLRIYEAKDLEEFAIDSPGEIYDSVISRDGCFNSLTEVYVELCSHLLDLTWLVLIPHLTVLEVTQCDNLEEIISSRKLLQHCPRRSTLEPFAKLQFLKLSKLLQLKSIYWNTLPFLYLEKMEIDSCPMLWKLPLDFNSAPGRKVVIGGENEWWENLEWQDDATKSRYFPRRIIQEKIRIALYVQKAALKYIDAAAAAPGEAYDEEIEVIILN